MIFSLFSYSVESSWATSFVEQPFPDTVKEAPVLVRGKVGTSYTNWAVGIDGTKRIYTFIDLQLTEALKGPQLGSSVIMRQIGGEKDGIGLEVAGTAHFEKGEDVVVMLGKANEDGSRDVYGLMMGKYNVDRAEDGRECLRGAGLSATAPPANGAPRQMIHHDEAPSHDASCKWTLDALKNLIQNQSQEGGHLASQAPNPGASVVTSRITKLQKSSTDDPVPDPLQASQLQSKSEQEPVSHGGWILMGILGGVGGLAVLIRYFRKRT